MCLAGAAVEEGEEEGEWGVEVWWWSKCCCEEAVVEARSGACFCFWSWTSEEGVAGAEWTSFISSFFVVELTEEVEEGWRFSLSTKTMAVVEVVVVVNGAAAATFGMFFLGGWSLPELSSAAASSSWSSASFFTRCRLPKHKKGFKGFFRRVNIKMFNF
jgi:hypothetical protein